MKRTGIFCYFVVAPVLFSLLEGAEGQCGNRTLLQADDYPLNITSPNFPGNYPYKARCFWHIRTAYPWFVVELRVLIMELEFSTDCQFDNLTVYDGSSSAGRLLATLCGNNTGLTISSTDRDMYIEFKSDGSVSRRGFRLSYRAVINPHLPTTARPSTGCFSTEPVHLIAERLNSSQGAQYIYYSTGFRSIFSQNCLMQWRIVVRYGGDVVKLKLMTRYVTGSLDFCNDDVLTVYDGGTASSPVLGSFCDHNVYYSTRPYMYITFQIFGDASMHFELQYQAVPSYLVHSTTLRPSTTKQTTVYNYYYDESIDSAAVVGGTVGAVTVLFVVIAACCWRGCCRQKRPTTSEATGAVHGGERRGEPVCLSEPPPSYNSAILSSSTFDSISETAPSLHTDSACISHISGFQNNRSAVRIVSDPSTGRVRFSRPRHINGQDNPSFSSSLCEPGSRTVKLPEEPPPSYNEAMMILHPPAIPPTSIPSIHHI